MKNVLLLITAILCFSSKNYSQNLQNAKWYFGLNAGLDFTPPNTTSPVPLTGGVINSPSTCASVSDQSGNLLFYVDANKVRNRLHGIMPNGSGLLTTGSDTQGAIIVPKPGNAQRYYLVTISGGSSMLGLHYSEVDMTLSGGNGDIVTATKNTVLQDYTGVNVNSTYGNLSEKLTSTKHSDGVNYWIVTQLRNRVHVYLASATGITFCCSTVAPVNIANVPGVPNSIQSGIGQMKISPDSQRIGICYSNDSTIANAGVLALGSFNNSTGSIVFDPLVSIAGQSLFYGLEFSPNSQIVYFSNFSNVYSTTGAGATINTLYTSSVPFTSGMQLGINQKIYVTGTTSSSSISVINNPDNLSSPDFQYTAVTIAGAPRNGLPQWVWNHNCQPLFLSSEPNTTYSYYDYGSITTESGYTIAATKDIWMKANTFIVLKPDTYIAPNSKYWAKIGRCGEVITQRQGIQDKPEPNLQPEEASSKIDMLFTLSPNPASRTVSLTAAENLQSILITSLDGKTVFKKDFRSSTVSYDIYVGDLVQGFYNVTIVTDGGRLHTEKLIKE